MRLFAKGDLDVALASWNEEQLLDLEVNGGTLPLLPVVEYYR